ncbi:diguanylate cyclase [Paenibacillus sp. 598K]|uniref:diguanylate cyclase n=1 Tax=Paenibacillus sp. 598K TaxID=1117987 RepID=UPI000FFE68AF|nr:diguanylate cyclase [Paenibacillus sp. 598K]
MDPTDNRNRLAKQDRGQRLIRQGRERFIQEMHQQLDEIETLIAEAATHEHLESSRTLFRKFHTMKGSAPVFGLMRIGQLAEELLLIWDWADCESADASSIPEAVARSLKPMERLTMEYDVCKKELELDYSGISKERPTMAGSRLLIIDDEDALRSYLYRRLELDDYKVMEAATVDEAKRLLHEHHFDLVILDLMMHPQSGYALFEFLKEDPTLKWLPLIVLSGRQDLEDKMQCLYLGADDYVTKPFQYEELAARIYSLLTRSKTYEQMAFRDPLTGVYNRRYLDHQIYSELQRIQRYPSPISVAFIDIDFFKRINDKHGHAAGDQVLQGLANLLNHHSRVTDLIARYGGEEFVILMPETTEVEAEQLVLKLRELVHRQPVAKVNQQSFQVTFSAGIVQWRDSMTAETWLQAADAAMYRAKNNGRDQVMIGTSVDEQANTSQTHQKTLLIADDDEILRKILVTNLSHLPVRILEASDGEQALHLLHHHIIDVCILDGVMPKIDGLTLLQRYKESADQRKGKTKVIMLSAKRKQDDVLKGLLLGADEYMAKPFSIVELEIRVKRMLQ